MTHKILFTLPTTHPSTSKLTRVLAICRSLDREIFTPFVSVDHPGRLHPEGARLLEEQEVNVFVMRMSPHSHDRIRSLTELVRTSFMLRKLDISIQHSFDFSRWWFEPLVAELGKVNHWITTKANTDIEGPHWRIRLRLARVVVAQAPQMIDLLKTGIPGIAKKIVFIPNGIDTEMFRPREPDRVLREQLSIGPSSLVLGCVAHLTPVKDHQALLHAFSKAVNTEVKLLLIGGTIDNEYVRNLRQLVDDLGIKDRVCFMGLRADIAQLHSLMDGIILTSIGESSSNAILEGMSSGLPVISSDVGGMPHAVHRGVNGWLVPRGENFVTTLTGAIDDWAKDSEKRRLFGEASRQIVIEKFSLSRMVKGHIHLYESLVQ